jgi:hypothetical protein
MADGSSVCRVNYEPYFGKRWALVGMRTRSHVHLPSVRPTYQDTRNFRLWIVFKHVFSNDCNERGVIWLEDWGPRFRFPVGVGNFSFHHRVQNGSGARPASYPMGTRGGSFPGGKAAGAWSWPLTSISCRGQRMRRAIPPLPQYAFMTWCLVKHRDNFTFYSHDCNEKGVISQGQDEERNKHVKE